MYQNLRLLPIIATCAVLTACESEPNPQRQSELTIESSILIDGPGNAVSLAIVLRTHSGAPYTLTSADSPLIATWDGSEVVAVLSLPGVYEAEFSEPQLGELTIETDFDTSTFKNEHMIRINALSLIVESFPNVIGRGQDVSIHWAPGADSQFRNSVRDLNVTLSPMSLRCDEQQFVFTDDGRAIDSTTEFIDENTSKYINRIFNDRNLSRPSRYFIGYT